MLTESANASWSGDCLKSLDDVDDSVIVKIRLTPGRAPRPAVAADPRVRVKARPIPALTIDRVPKWLEAAVLDELP